MKQEEEKGIRDIAEEEGDNGYKGRVDKEHLLKKCLHVFVLISLFQITI
jgi:hypothetical protein